MNYLDQNDAFTTGLARVDSTTQHAIIKVDNTSEVMLGGNRSSVCASQYTGSAKFPLALLL